MLENLNEQQLEAVTCVDQHLCIIAGAGSGKTRVVTTRIAHLINEYQIKDYRILAITFTNRAAKELKDRLETLVENHQINAMTIHSLCVRILRRDIHHLGYESSFTILDNEDQIAIIKEIIKVKSINIAQIKPSEIIYQIGNYKMNNVSIEEAYRHARNEREKLFATLYDKYEKRLFQTQSVDFNDLLLLTRKVLQIDEVFEKWSNRFSFIHIDEFQDVDEVQYDIIKLLCGEHTNLCVVGDPDQCIYTWRGADVKFILNFTNDFAFSKQIILNQNYRSTPEILKAANSLIANNKERIEKDLTSTTQSGNKVQHYSGSSESEEADFVVDTIKKLKTNGESYSEMAVLYRSNFSSRAIEKALFDAKIPYVIIGSVRFYERAEIKDALSYFKLLVDTPAIDLAFTRVINIPKRGIGEKTVSNLREIAIKENMTMYDVLRKIEFASGKTKKTFTEFVTLIEKHRQKLNKMPLFKVLGSLLSESGYYAMLQDNNETARIENVKALLQDIQNFEETNNTPTIEQYLQDVALYSDREEIKNEAVSLLTVHAAKGSEYDYVFVYNMSEGIFPSDRSIIDGKLEEERRIAYVAMTRARKQLYLCESRGFNLVRDSFKATSRFIKEIDAQYITSSLRSPLTVTKQVKKPLQVVNAKYSRNDKIVHDRFGDGVIISIDDNGIATIAFAKPHGIKKLLATHPAIKKR